MKILSTLLFALLFLLGNQVAYSQVAAWRQMSDFPGGPRTGAFSFAINNKIYIGGGASNGDVYSDFWEYDINSGTWTRKADFGGGKRSFAVAFSIGTKGYAGTGAVDESANTIVKDFWQYNPATNKWIRKADFGGGVRYQAFGAATTDRGYIGTGLTSKDITSLKKDFWEYNPATNQWRKRDNLGFIGRFGATAFAMNGKIYAGTGVNNFAQAVKDFNEYNPATNRWRRKAAYSGIGVYNAVSFAISGVGYLGTGINDGGTFHKEFWKYDLKANKWTKAPALPGEARTGATAVSSNNSGYVLTGFNGRYLTDMWDLEQLPISTTARTAETEKMVAAPAGTPVSIAPNPATTHFNLRMNKGNETAHTVLLIYTMQGNLAMKYDLGTISGNFSKTINVASLTSGVYKVVIERGASRETTSLIISR